MKTLRQFQVSCIATALLAQAGASQAQQANALALEEVIVTATKREASMQDVPVAVTALSAELIAEQQIVSSADLAQLVPSLNVQQGAGPRGSSFNIRGIGTQSFSLAAEPSVSTMLDGVVLGTSGQAFMQLMDLERVEVLRGPQGTLFGKNSTGGVVHLITANPSEEFTGEVMGALVNNEEYRSGFTVSGPFSDSLGYRLSGSYMDVGGYTENIYTGNDLNGSDEWTVRGKLRWTGDSIDLVWASDYGKKDCDCTASPVSSIEPFGGNEATVDDILDRLAPLQPNDKETKVNINNEPHYETEQWGHSLTANWDFGEHTLTSITAYRESEFDGTGDGDLDGQPVDVIGVRQPSKTNPEQFTQELRITSPADGTLTYVAGLFYFDQTAKRHFTRELLILGSSGTADFKVDTRNWAAFGELTWHLRDDWRLLLGARYTEDEVDFDFQRVGSGAGIPASIGPISDGTDESDLSGKVALQWDYSDEGMTYLSFVQGYKGPAFDITFGSDVETLQPVDPETSDSWELGLKTRFWDGRVMLNAALYHTGYDDFQTQAYFDPDGDPGCGEPGCDPDDDPGGFLLVNAGKVTSEGLEVDLMAQLTESLRVSGGFALIDASIDDLEEGNCSSNQSFRGECPEGSQDLSGGDLPFSPDWKLNLTTAYTWFRDSRFDVTFTGSVRAQDEVQYDISQDPDTIGDSYAILDLFTKLEGHSDRWDATLFVKNVFDEFYPSVIFITNSQIIPNATFHRYPKTAERTYGIDLRYRW